MKRPDEFYTEIAAIVLDVGPGRHGAADRIAERWNVPRTTAHRWIKEARTRGLLGSPSQRSERVHRPVWARVNAASSTGMRRQFQVCNECLTEWPCLMSNVEGHPSGSPNPFYCDLYDYCIANGDSHQHAMAVIAQSVERSQQ